MNGLKLTDHGIGAIRAIRTKVGYWVASGPGTLSSDFGE